MLLNSSFDPCSLLYNHKDQQYENRRDIQFLWQIQKINIVSIFLKIWQGLNFFILTLLAFGKLIFYQIHHDYITDLILLSSFFSYELYPCKLHYGVPVFPICLKEVHHTLCELFSIKRNKSIWWHRSQFCQPSRECPYTIFRCELQADNW